MTTTPTTEETADSIESALDTAQTNIGPRILPVSFLRTIANAFAGSVTSMYKYIQFLALQMFVATASFQEIKILGLAVRPLVFWGRLVGAGDPTPATRAEATIDVPVLNQTGQIDSGTLWRKADTGVTYAALTNVLLNAATVQVTVRAIQDQADNFGFGAIGNVDPGDELVLAQPFPEIGNSATVVTLDTVGENEEDEAGYRQRVIDTFQKRPRGGNLADYEFWAESVAGVIRAFPYPGDEPSRVEVYCEVTAPSVIADVQAFLGTGVGDGIAPVPAIPEVFEVTYRTFDVFITNLQAPDLAAAQQAATDTVNDYINEREPYIGGLTVPPRTDDISQIVLQSEVQQAVAALGGTLSGLTIQEGGIPQPVFTLGKGELAQSTITFD